MKRFADLSEGNVIRFEGRQVAAGFTCRDLVELQDWDTGGRRIEVDPCADRMGQYAMIYRGQEPWASWAITREGGRVLVWDCISLADVGRFDCMRDALDAVPGQAPQPERPAFCAEVIPFSALRARRSAV